MVKTCEFILSTNKYCKNYCRYTCNINKIHNLCSIHGNIVLSYYAEKIQRFFKKTKLKPKILLFKNLPIELKVKIIDYCVYPIRMEYVYNLYARFISKRINISLNTIDWYKLFYTRYSDVYHYFTDNDSLSSFCKVLELIKKYFCVIKNKINLKNIKNICEELKKIYCTNYSIMTAENVSQWNYVINLIETMPSLKRQKNT